MKITLRNPARVQEVPGPASVHQLLTTLDINPETVLVIHDGTLVTKDYVLPADAQVEIRPVISGGAGPAKCRCGDSSVIEIARHRAAYCAPCFLDHVRSQVRDAITRYGMMSYDDRILVAVSGGKDSLALWDVLLDMGYRADGMYLGLGIGEYSDNSEQIVRDYAEARGATLHLVDLAEEYGYDIPQATGLKDRSSCGVCGLSKRYAFNKIALDGAYDVMATGHNLDDEAAQLLGNVLRWQTPFMARQSPALPASETMAKKVKPLYRLGEREMAAYCVIKGIDYVVEECPMVGGNTVLRYKDALNELERHSPGTKGQFLFGFLERARPQLFPDGDPESARLVDCHQCGMPTMTPPRQTEGADGAAEPVLCAFCRTRGRILHVVERDAARQAAAAEAGA